VRKGEDSPHSFIHGCAEVVAAVDLRLPAGPRASLRILAFEAAAAMSKLLWLHRSMSDQESSHMRSDEAGAAPRVRGRHDGDVRWWQWRHGRC
jgi:hypothetical protein